MRCLERIHTAGSLTYSEIKNSNERGCVRAALLLLTTIPLGSLWSSKENEQSSNMNQQMLQFAAVGLVSRAMASEEDEVRALLMRHRKQIIRDVNESELITVLTQKGVLSATNHKQLTDIQLEKYRHFGLNNGPTPIIKKLAESANGYSNGGSVSETIKSHLDNDNEVDEKKCMFLIDVIAQNGFDKFKEFCYAIESECPRLIEDLIHDRLNGGKFCLFTQNKLNIHKRNRRKTENKFTQN